MHFLTSNGAHYGRKPVDGEPDTPDDEQSASGGLEFERTRRLAEISDLRPSGQIGTGTD